MWSSQNPTRLNSKAGSLIELCLSRGVSFYAMRRPDGIFRWGASPAPLRNLSAGGFVISPFDGKPEGCVTIIPSLDEESLLAMPENSNSDAYGLYPMAIVSTSRRSHRREVSEIVSALKTEGEGKTVAARVIVRKHDTDTSASFIRLCDKYPSACVFCFYTPQSGLWLGATPELLLCCDNDSIRTMALAGTRKSGSTDITWDSKNIEEQQIVTDYISHTFRKNGLEPQAGKPYTRKAGQIEHICTDISALRHSDCDSSRILALARDMSPTPALCGYPRKLAFSLINRLEDFNRAYYGGFFGEVSQDGCCCLYVNLRCARCGIGRTAIYTGGGITRFSDPDAEWEETELKAMTMADNLAMKP